MENIPKSNKPRAFNKAVGPGKKSKKINIGPRFIPDYRVFESDGNSKILETLSRVSSSI